MANLGKFKDKLEIFWASIKLKSNSFFKKQLSSSEDGGKNLKTWQRERRVAGRLPKPLANKIIKTLGGVSSNNFNKELAAEIVKLSASSIITILEEPERGAKLTIPLIFLIWSIPISLSSILPT